MADNNEAQIRTLAYQLWEEAGSPPDRADEFWLAAKQLLADEGLAPDPDDPVEGLPLPPLTPPV